jgi:VanZ family protein
LREAIEPKKQSQKVSKQKAMFWLLSLLWMVVIFWLSASPDAQGSFWLLELIPFQDKGAHALTFGSLALLLYLASRRYGLAFLLTALYGISDEIHQHFVPGRSADVTDWFADITGSALGLGMVWVFSSLNEQRRRHAE